MDKLKKIGLNLLAIVMFVVAVPMIILWAIAYFIMYWCFSVYEWIMWHYDDLDICDLWNEVPDIYAKICECMRDLILELKIEL